MDDDAENNISSSLLEPPRRRSLTIPTSNGHHHITTTPPSQSPFDFELVSLNSPTYISLRDLISPPSPFIILSPPATTAVSILSAASNASSAASGYEIGIRNRLVKQAAWAYLQPMSTSPSSSGSRIIGCGTWPAVVVAGGRWFVEAATRVWRWLEDAVWFLLCR